MPWVEETVWERNLAPGPGSLPTPLCRGSPVMVTTTWDSSQSRPSFWESWAQSLVFLWMARVTEEGDRGEAGLGRCRTYRSQGKWAKAEVLFWADCECVPTASLTWIGQTWGQAGRRVMLQKARWRSRGAGETWAAGGKVGVWATCLECCELAPAAWAVPSACGLLLKTVPSGCSWSPEKAWAAASVHVLIDFLEQGMQ